MQACIFAMQACGRAQFGWQDGRAPLAAQQQLVCLLLHVHAAQQHACVLDLSCAGS